MVLYCYLVFVEILVFKISPSPLAVITVSHSAGTHGAVAYEEEYGVVALAGRARHRACLVGKGDRVGSEVTDTVDVEPDVIFFLTVGSQEGEYQK